MEAVVLDLFGTLVNAPTPDERLHAAARLAPLLDCGTATVEHYFSSTWNVRHDGTLHSVADLASHLVRTVRGPDEAVKPVADELLALGRARLVPAPSVVYMLQSLRSNGTLLGVLSDASAEIAAAWPRSPLAALVDAAVFSCTAGAVKPDQRLYHGISDVLGVQPQRTLYVGDGGGDELRGAMAASMVAVAVRRRGPSHALAFNHTDWSGSTLDAVEDVPAYLLQQA